MTAGVRAAKARPVSMRPPIRRPVLFYACVVVAFGLLGAAVIALGRVS